MMVIVKNELRQGDIDAFLYRHFLYAKFHTDISPIGAHDDPAVGADFHYLPHTFFECNYGVPLIDFDRLFGTYKEYVKKPAGDNKQ